MAKQSTKKKRKVTPYHEYLGTMFKLLEIQLVKILTDVDVVKQMPKADILILLREGAVWTDEQRRYLPDGVRDGNARHKLLEFKYTESFNEDALEQIMGYDIFYRRTHELSRDELDSYVLISMTPDSKTLSKFGYEETALSGIYRSKRDLINRITLVILNDLSDEEYNAYVKLFASKKPIKQKAVEQLQEIGALSASTQLGNYLFGLVKTLFKGEDMKLTRDEVLMPEDLMEIGREFAQSYWKELSPEEQVAQIDIGQLMSVLPSEDILKHLSLDEIEEHLQSRKRRYSD